MSTKPLRILWPVLLTLALTLCVWALVTGRSKRLWDQKVTITPMKASATLIQNASGPRANDRVQNIRFTLYDAGILPRELHIDKGLVSITIEDRTRLSTGLVIQREVGNAQIVIGQVQRFANHWRGRREVRLTPGTYVISDASRPANRAKLVVAP